MQFKDFIETVREEVAKRTGKDTMVYPVIKNNDTVYQGLVIKDPVLNLAPTIYLEPYFYRYEDGESMEVLIDDILNTYEEHLPTKDFNISLFMDFGKAKHRITMKVVNTERNKKLLQKVTNIFHNGHIHEQLLLILLQYLLKSPFPHKRIPESSRNL